VQPAKSDKAKLISRMAKMGQPMLPVVNPSTVDVPEHEVIIIMIMIRSFLLNLTVKYHYFYALASKDPNK